MQGEVDWVLVTVYLVFMPMGCALVALTVLFFDTGAKKGEGSAEAHPVSDLLQLGAALGLLLALMLVFLKTPRHDPPPVERTAVCAGCGKTFPYSGGVKECALCR